MTDESIKAAKEFSTRKHGNPSIHTLVTKRQYLIDMAEFADEQTADLREALKAVRKVESEVLELYKEYRARMEADVSQSPIYRTHWGQQDAFMTAYNKLNRILDWHSVPSLEQLQEAKDE